MDDLAVRIKALLAGGASLDAVLSLLRQLGFSKGGTMFFLTEELGMNGDEVPELVHNSDAWADRFESDAKLSSAVMDLLDSLREVSTDGPVDLTAWLASMRNDRDT